MRWCGGVWGGILVSLWRQGKPGKLVSKVGANFGSG